jgi:hypothetical protein
MEIPLEMYPVAIRESRYGGVYEGGAWFAIANCDYIPEDAIGSDDEACDFWSSDEAKMIGRGDTPNDAVIDLLERHVAEAFHHRKGYQ